MRPHEPRLAFNTHLGVMIECRDCIHCSQMIASATTECPGFYVLERVCTMVERGRLDFKGGRWAPVVADAV